MSTILLTGAAGFIGSHTAQALIARGNRVVGVDNFCDFYPRAWKEANLRALFEAEKAAREREEFEAWKKARAAAAAAE